MISSRKNSHPDSQGHSEGSREKRRQLHRRRIREKQMRRSRSISSGTGKVDGLAEVFPRRGPLSF